MIGIIKEISIGLKAIFKIKNWVKFLRIHLGYLKGGEHTIFLRNGTRFSIRGAHTDAAILREVAVQDFYRLRNEKEIDVALDIGGALGAFSVLASKKARKVLVFEPFPENFRMIKKNISLNSADNVIPFNLAVGGKRGKLKLFVDEQNLGGHSIYGNSGKSILVDSIPLKEIFTGNGLTKIDFLKMDCEGAEYSIFYATPKKYLQKIGKIAMEHHETGGHSVSELARFLEKNGFIVDIDRFMLYAENKAAVLHNS